MFFLGFACIYVYENSDRHSGQVDWVEDWNHLYRHVEWNLCLHVRHDSLGSW